MNMDRKKGIVPFTSVELFQVVLKYIQKQRQKWERKKLQLSQETFKLLFYSGREVQRRHFCGTCKRIEIEEHVVTDLDVRNDDNRPSLNSGAAAEERQVISSKNATDELSDAITVGKDIGLWSSDIPEKMREYWLKNEKLFLKHDVQKHRKDRKSSRKCTTNLVRRRNYNAEFVERSWLSFSPSQTCVYCFTCRLMSADATNCAHFLIRKQLCDWKHAEEPWAINGT